MGNGAALVSYKLYIEIVVAEFDWDPDVITSFTGITPTRVYRKGVNNKPRNSWKVSSYELESKEFSDHWNWIKQRIGDKYLKLCDLLDSSHIRELNIVVSQYDNYPEIVIPPDFLDLAEKLWTEVKIYTYNYNE